MVVLDLFELLDFNQVHSKFNFKLQAMKLLWKSLETGQFKSNENHFQIPRDQSVSWKSLNSFAQRWSILLNLFNLLLTILRVNYSYRSSKQLKMFSRLATSCLFASRFSVIFFLIFLNKFSSHSITYQFGTKCPR